MVQSTDTRAARMLVRVRSDALDEAAALLERTAEDYDQMAEQERKAYDESARRRYLGAIVHRERMSRYTDQAALLRGQAKHIRELKTK